MSVLDYLRAVRSRWLTVLIFLMFGAVVSGAYSMTQTPKYESTLQLFVSTSIDNADATQIFQGGTFTQQRVKSYADIVSSPEVTKLVVDSLGLSYSPDDLSDEITASIPEDTVLLEIAVLDTSPERARDIAAALAVHVPKFIAAIETPAGHASSPVKVSVTRNASLPVSPVSPRSTLNLIIGLIAGLCIGVFAGILRDRLDTTVRLAASAAQAADAPLLGTIAEDKTLGNGLGPSSDGRSILAEQFKRLRTNIRFLSIDRKVRSIVVTGSLPGEGKTTTAFNLARSLAEAGERVVLIDGDLRKPRIADLLALSGAIGLTNVLLGDVNLAQATQRWRDDLPLYILASGPVPPNPSELLASEALTTVVQDCLSAGMTVVFDSPPLLPVTDASVIAQSMDGALLVVRVGRTKTDEVASAAEALRTVDAKLLGVIANRAGSQGRRSSNYGDYYGGPVTAP